MSGSVESPDHRPAGVSRRSLLRGAAIGGAVMWTAPVVTMTTAHAESTVSPSCEGSVSVTVAEPIRRCNFSSGRARWEAEFRVFVDVAENQTAVCPCNDASLPSIAIDPGSGLAGNRITLTPAATPPPVNSVPNTFTLIYRGTNTGNESIGVHSGTATVTVTCQDGSGGTHTTRVPVSLSVNFSSNCKST